MPPNLKQDWLPKVRAPIQGAEILKEITQSATGNLFIDEDAICGITNSMHQGLISDPLKYLHAGLLRQDLV